MAALVDRLRAQEERLRAVRAELSALAAPATEAPGDIDARMTRIVRGLRERLRADLSAARDALALVLDGPLRVVWLGPRAGVRLRGSAVPARLLDLGESGEPTRGPSMSPAGPGQSPRRVLLDRAA